MLYKTFRGAVHSFYSTYCRANVTTAFEFYLHIFIADGYPIDRLLDDEAILRVRHCIFIIFCIF